MFSFQNRRGLNRPILRPLWLMTSAAADVISVPSVTWDLWISAQRASNVESTAMLWHHHEKCECVLAITSLYNLHDQWINLRLQAWPICQFIQSDIVLWGRNVIPPHSGIWNLFCDVHSIWKKNLFDILFRGFLTNSYNSLHHIGWCMYVITLCNIYNSEHQSAKMSHLDFVEEQI